MRSLVPIVVVLGACAATPPDVVIPPDDHGPTDQVYADVVLGFTSGADATSCVEGGGVPVCTANPTPQTGPCANYPALGPPDMRLVSIGPISRIEVGFLCSTIVETGINPTNPGAASDDFVIVGTVSDGAIPVVEVSIDGTHYQAVNFWPKTNNVFATQAGFQLEVPMWEAARFVRISNTSTLGTIGVDAVVALPRAQ